ncbi:MAG: hypothetical protein U0R52_06170 [Solirubrobacterales bacterium]
MAAHRKYSDEQRAAMFRLYEGGLGAKAISERCAAGTTGTAPFEIPRRTVQEIVTAMAAEARLEPPRSISDAGTEEALLRFPERCGALLAREMQRLEAAGEKRALTEKELARLGLAVKVWGPLETRLRRRAAKVPTQQSPEERAKEEAAFWEAVGDDDEPPEWERGEPEQAEEQASPAGAGGLPSDTRIRPAPHRPLPAPTPATAADREAASHMEEFAREQEDPEMREAALAIARQARRGPSR